jgi:lauroyl/myristoyl acyltransferase
MQASMDVSNAIADKPVESRSQKQEAGLSLGARTKFMVIRGFLWGWARLFSLKGLYLFGQFFGFCEWLVNYKRRRRFHKRARNLMGDHYKPHKQHRWACLYHFTRTRCDKLFYLIFDKLPREKILKRIRFHNQHLLDEALERNKGTYVSLSHYGSHHVLILLMALMGYKVAGVRDRNEGALRRYVQQKYEETFPEFRDIRMFFADTYPRDLYRCFKDNYILGTALDIGRQRGKHLKTASVKLFDKEREFLTGTMQIALRCGAPVLQGFLISKKNFYFHVVVEGPLIDPDKSKDESEVLQTAMQKYADNIAQKFIERPSHISKS